MKSIVLAAALAAFAAPALADDIETRAADGDVATVFQRLENAIAEAGATIFARIDHAEGAQSVEMELAPARLIVFGNPMLGTPAMQQDIRAGLYLPLRMLVYQNAEGGTVIAWEEPDEMLDDLDIDDDAEWLEKMEDALERFAETAASDN